MPLKNNPLFHQKAFVAGRWQDAKNTQRVEIINPANQEILGSVPKMGSEEALVAIEAADRAWPQWRKLCASDRSRKLKKWYQLIVESVDALAQILTLEQGKPLAEARGEILYAASFVEWFAEEAKRVYGDVIPSPHAGTQIVVTKQPVGIVAAITPWNFPAAMITRKVAPALAAGCPCIVKPAPDTPFTALALADLAAQAGIPDGLLSVLTGDAQAIGQTLLESDKVRKLTFTGSTSVGAFLYAQAAKSLKKVSLELGGNAPFIVFDDADIERTAEHALAAKFRNAGQTCVCVNRFLVHDAIYDDFIQALAGKMRNLRLGSGIDPEVDIGPLINEEAIQKVQQHIDDALQKGGEIVIGGHLQSPGSLFFEPTLIVNANLQMAVFSEETFGPLAAVFRFHDEQEAVRLANDTQYGLAAYCFTENLGRAWRMSEQLEYGMVGINEGLISNEVAPFGGVKHSGLGREGSKYGIEEYLEMKYTLFGGLDEQF